MRPLLREEEAAQVAGGPATKGNQREEGGKEGRRGLLSGNAFLLSRQPSNRCITPGGREGGRELQRDALWNPITHLGDRPSELRAAGALPGACRGLFDQLGEAARVPGRPAFGVFANEKL